MNIKIVSNKFNEDVSWIENSKYEKEIIEKEINYGNEALSYLIFICKIAYSSYHCSALVVMNIRHVA